MNDPLEMKGEKAERARRSSKSRDDGGRRKSSNKKKEKSSSRRSSENLIDSEDGNRDDDGHRRSSSSKKKKAKKSESNKRDRSSSRRRKSAVINPSKPGITHEGAEVKPPAEEVRQEKAETPSTSYTGDQSNSGGAEKVPGGSTGSLALRRPSQNEGTEPSKPGALAMSGGSQYGKQRRRQSEGAESVTPAAVEMSGGSQTGKQRRSYGATGAQRGDSGAMPEVSFAGKEENLLSATKPGAVAVASPAKRGKQWSAPGDASVGAVSVDSAAPQGKSRGPSMAVSADGYSLSSRVGAVSVSAPVPQAKRAQSRRSDERVGATAVASAAPSGKQRSVSHRGSSELPKAGAVSVASTAPKGKSRGPSMAISADGYSKSSLMGAVSVSAPAPQGKRDQARSSDARVGATSVASAAPMGKRRSGSQRRSTESSGVGAVSMASGAPRGKRGAPLETSNVSQTDGIQSLPSHAGAYSVAKPTMRGKGDGPSIAPVGETFESASEIGAYSVSSVPRRKRGDAWSVSSRDDSSQVGAQSVASSGSSRKGGTGPLTTERSDDYGRRVSSSINSTYRSDNSTGTSSHKDRVSHFPTSDLYESLSSLPGGTNTENKGRISQFPGEDFYEEEIDYEPSNQHKKNVSKFRHGSEKDGDGGPSYSTSGEVYGGSDARNDQSRRSTRTHQSDQQSRSSADQPRRRSTGAYFISGDGGNFETREPVVLHSSDEEPNIDFFSLQDSNATGVDFLAADVTAEVALVENFQDVEGAPAFATDAPLIDLKSKPWYCSRTCWILLAVLVIFGGAVGAALPLVVLKHDASVSPTSSPTQPVDVERQNAIRSVVLTSNVTDASTLDDILSPQNKAYNWLVSVDMLSAVADADASLEGAAKVLSRYALAVFYYSTNGPEWVSSSRWMNGTADVCDWEFLSCIDQDVTAINTDFLDRGNNMVGGIPSELKTLTSLIDLVLPSNRLGPLHSDLGKLTRVEKLDLYNNQITGNFPEFIYELTALRYLDLNNNAFAGTLSGRISGMTNLTHLDIQLNRFTGSISNELSGLLSLQFLDLSLNSFYGDFHGVIDGLNDLEQIYMYENSFDGALEGQKLLSYPALLELDVGVNQIHGTIPSEFGNLPNLKTLILGQNMLSGTVPSGLANLAPLEIFQLDSTQITGIVPAELCAVETLKEIRVDCALECSCSSCVKGCAP